MHTCDTPDDIAVSDMGTTCDVVQVHADRLHCIPILLQVLLECLREHLVELFE